ncbi:MAG TPA: RsmG family class I SAM-dependent methyltransferase [Myxococcota bacterium]|nr:RsmG family class I SAM-dependent methyltransferase [Myxococcota bacterium]
MEHSGSKAARSEVGALTDLGRILDTGLAALDLELGSTQRDQLLDLTLLLDRWNERINLSGHHGAADLMARSILESLALAKELPRVDSIVDLGSGAGVPGLPIAILRPETQVLLVEAREKRHHFQRAAIRNLHTKNVRTLRGRIEELEAEPARLAIAQAVVPPPRMLPSMLPWVSSGGFAVIPGGGAPPDPGTHAEILDVEVRSYRAPASGDARTLWIGRRR